MSRVPWRMFGLLIAVPAIVLAWLGLRAGRAERLEAEQQLRVQQTQIARLADAAILNVLTQLETELPRLPSDGLTTASSLPRDLPLVVFHRAGVITFPRDRVYFGPFGRHPPERERLTAWPAGLSALIEHAEAAEAQGRSAEALMRLQRIRRAEPRLQAWTDIATMRLRWRRGEAAALSELLKTEWSRLPGVTPSGLPAAFVACAVSDEMADGERRAFAPLIESTLAGIREGRWWLSADERRFYGKQLGAFLQRAGGRTPPSDTRLDGLAAIEQVVRQSPPSRRSAPTHGLERGTTSTFLLIWAPADSDADAWNGIAVPQDRTPLLIGPALERLLAGQPFLGAIRDATGTVIWGPRAGVTPSWHAERLETIPGWDLAFGGPADAGAIGDRQWLWYGFVSLMLIVLLAALGMTAHTVRREMELARMQSDFVAAVTHEFKSPITSIRLLLERIAGGRVASAQAAATYCGAISQETDRLERLVNRLLEAQQIDAGQRQYHCAPESLEEITNDVIGHMRPVADAKGVNIELRVDRPIPPVLIDRESIADAIENLVDNAIKYSPPIENPDELGSSLAGVLARLARDFEYPAQFRAAFGGDMSPEDVARALASYVRSILAGDSPVDRYLAGAPDALSSDAQAGLRIFRGKGNCTACHLGPTFSDERFHNTGVAWAGGVLSDSGRAAVSGRTDDRGAFKTPTLRHVGETAPYMHDGSVVSLEDVIDFYDRGGNPNPHLDPEIMPLRLTRSEKTTLGAFLRSLSGHMTN